MSDCGDEEDEVYAVLDHERTFALLTPDSVTHRCPICDWPFALTCEQGCVPGDCSYRPNVGSDEWFRIKRNRDKMTAPESLPSRDTNLSTDGTNG